MKFLLNYIFIGSLATATTINVPTDYSTIQAGIDVAVDGDTILVQPGTYYENISFLGKEILLTSFFTTTGDSNYIEYTTISGLTLPNSVISFENNEDSTSKLIGFTIKKGIGNLKDPDGDGLYYHYGGGIYCENSSPLISDIILLENSASGGGGGIFCYNASPTVIRTKFINNGVADVGGGIYCKYNSHPQLFNVIFNNNVAGYGGAIYLRDTSTVFIEGIYSKDNEASSGGFLLAKVFSDISIINGRILNINFQPLQYFIEIKEESRLYLNNITINNYNNAATINVTGNSELFTYHSLITGNSSILVYNNSVGIFDNTTFANNIISSGLSGSVLDCRTSSIFVNKCTATNNSIGNGFILNQNSNLTVLNSILWNSSESQIFIATGSNYSSTMTTIGFSNILGGETQIANHYLSQINDLGGIINEIPLFEFADSTDVSLDSDSPCIDAGENLIVFANDTLVEIDTAMFCGFEPDMGSSEYCFTVSNSSYFKIPYSFKLHGNYPNPFNPTTTLLYDLPEDALVIITIYDIVGRVVTTLVNQDVTAGYRSALWNGTDTFGKPVSSGMYIYQIQAGSFVQSKKMLLLK